MTKDGVRLLSDSADILAHSFIKVQKKQRDYAILRYLQRENTKFNGLLSTVPLQTMIDARANSDNQLLSWEVAKILSSLEATILLAQFPQFLIGTVTFPYLYRLFRTLELSLGLKRGGNTLFIGSGLTLPEFMANYVESSSVKDIIKIYEEYKEDLLAQRASGFITARTSGSFPKPKSWLDGKAVVIEPDENELKNMQEINVHFDAPIDRITQYAITIGSAIRHNLAPVNLDAILWIRSDPDIFFAENFSGKAKKQARRSIRTIFAPILRQLSVGGHFILTVGAGNNDRERDQRKELLLMSKKCLPELGQTIKYLTPYFVLTGEREIFGAEFGNMGCIASIRSK